MDLSWKTAGACRWVEPELFFPASDADAGPAKAVCTGCHVQERCLEYALANREYEGVWGGTTGPERRSILRRRRSTALTA
ncbi:MAG: WhiB family transcriptional regulator [Acidobacteria bacterium]|nr:WhiB family transcriptional regulator [Acidobacteriota bacterium]